MLLNAVQGISDLIQYHGYINVDFADVKTIMGEQGLALMGTGRASGEKRALRAMEQAIASPLLEDVTIDGARGLLINITAGRDITLQEVNEAVSLVHDAADPEANIIFGSLIDENSNDEVKITIIADWLVVNGPVASAQQHGVPAPNQVPVPLKQEVATLVPVKTGSRSLASEPKLQSPRTAVARENSLQIDEDQFDIPTFLRRQGHTELP